MATNRIGLIVRSFIMVLVALSLAQCSEKAKNIPAGDPDNGGLLIPGNFEALVVADSIGRARHLAVNKNGDIYVKLRFADHGLGGTVALRDTTGDGKADIISNFGDYQDEGGLANGITIHKDYLYYSSARKVYRNKLTPGKLIPESKMELILTDDHDHGIHWHITKPMVFDDKGNMYIPFGSPSDACQDISVGPIGVPGGKGLDPCPELENHGGVWKFDANKKGQTQQDGVRYASGLRSIVGMRWNETDNGLYAVVHGIDNFHTMFPETFSAWQGAVLPAEELVKIEEGDNFGWPYCYYDQMQNKRFLQPGYGGDGLEEGTCGDFDLPLMGFPGHWGPNDLLFYRGDQFPNRYRNGVFIAFHGSTDRPPYPQAGYFVCFVPFKNGKPRGDWEVFADGFAQVDTIFNTSDAKHRPMGLAEGPDGSLYVSDSRRGKIWRIMYKGNRKDYGATQMAEMETRKSASYLKTPDEELDNLERDQLAGRRVYKRYCSTCHQRNGKGDENRFPPLAGSEWVTGDPDRLMDVVLNGLQGEINVNGKNYNGLMPGFDYLADHQVSEILTFIRQNFGNEALEITEQQVRDFRKRDLATRNDAGD